MGIFAVYGAAEHLCGGGFTRSADARKNVGVACSAGYNLIAKGFCDMILTYHIVKVYGSPAAVKSLICQDITSFQNIYVYYNILMKKSQVGYPNIVVQLSKENLLLLTKSCGNGIIIMKLKTKMEFKYIHESRRKAQTGQ